MPGRTWEVADKKLNRQQRDAKESVLVALMQTYDWCIQSKRNQAKPGKIRRRFVNFSFGRKSQGLQLHPDIDKKDPHQIIYKHLIPMSRSMGYHSLIQRNTAETIEKRLPQHIGDGRACVICVTCQIEGALITRCIALGRNHTDKVTRLFDPADGEREWPPETSNKHVAGEVIEGLKRQMQHCNSCQYLVYVLM